MKKVSIVVSLYNAELYAARCVNSVVNQTFGLNNIELILIDDCSSDGTAAVIKELANEHPEDIVLVLHEENKGANYNRNLGMSMASGEYLMYIDADDCIDNTMVEKAVKAIEETGCDIVDIDYNYFRDEANISVKRTAEDRICNLTEYNDRKWYVIGYPKLAVWGKLYKLSRLREMKVRFVDGWKVGDDFLFTGLIKFMADSVYILNEELYHVYLAPQSLSRGGNYAEKMIELRSAAPKLIELMKEYGIYDRVMEEFREELGWYITSGTYFVVMDYWLREIRASRDTIREIFPDIRDNRFMQTLDSEYREYMEYIPRE